MQDEIPTPKTRPMEALLALNSSYIPSLPLLGVIWMNTREVEDGELSAGSKGASWNISRGKRLNTFTYRST